MASCGRTDPPVALLARLWSGVQRVIKATKHEPKKGDKTMSSITTKDGTQIYYKDWGAGEPVVFSHGWPLNADSWEAQMVFLASHGYRCIAHDRRGHGRSSQPWAGNDMDTGACHGGPFCRRGRDRVRHLPPAWFPDATISAPAAYRHFGGHRNDESSDAARQGLLGRRTWG